MARSATKAARMAVLLELQRDGVLNELTQAELGRFFDVDRATILRDLLVLDDVEREYRRMMATQPWITRYYTPAQFANAAGCNVSSVYRWIESGVVNAARHGRYWRIPISEVERYWEQPRNGTGIINAQR